jgi:alkaline phosphatase
MNPTTSSQESLLEQGQQELALYSSLSILGISFQYKKSQQNRFALVLFSLLLLLSGFLFLFGYLIGVPNQPIKPPVKNVILMISDGFGPASQTFARTYYQYIHSLPNNTKLPLDHLLGMIQ